MASSNPPPPSGNGNGTLVKRQRLANIDICQKCFHYFTSVGYLSGTSLPSGTPPPTRDGECAFPPGKAVCERCKSQAKPCARSVTTDRAFLRHLHDTQAARRQVYEARSAGMPPAVISQYITAAVACGKRTDDYARAHPSDFWTSRTGRKKATVGPVAPSSDALLNDALLNAMSSMTTQILASLSRTRRVLREGFTAAARNRGEEPPAFSSSEGDSDEEDRDEDEA